MAESEGIAFTVFTKSWVEPLPALAERIKSYGLDGIELPIRDGYQVEPGNVGPGLKEAVRIFREHGLKIGSVAGPTDEATIAACGEAGVKILRIMAPIDLSIGYFASEARYRETFDLLLPLLDKHNVTIGVQNHCGNMVGSSIGLMHLIEKYDPKHVCAVLDVAHCSLDGEPTEMALDIAWPQMRGLINFKSAFRRRVNGPEAIEARYEIHWTTAHHSGFSWSELVSLLKKRGFTGDVCLSAEYTDLDNPGQQLMGEAVPPLLMQDIKYIKHLFETVEAE